MVLNFPSQILCQRDFDTITEQRKKEPIGQCHSYLINETQGTKNVESIHENLCDTNFSIFQKCKDEYVL